MNHIVWDVSPIIFQLGPLKFRWYGMLFGMGFLIGYFIMHWMYAEEGKPEEDVEWFLIYSLIGTTVGARLGHCLFYDPVYYLSNPIKFLKIWEGGLASHGAAIGLFITFYIYSRRRKDQPYLWVLDRLAIVTALSAIFIRLGNLFNSEILGVKTDVPWAFVFKRIDNVPRHPAQLYESLTYLVIFVILLRVYKRKKGRTPHGLIIGLFMMMIFGTRFFIEFIKVRQAAFAKGMTLSMGQWLSIPAVLLGYWLFHIARKAPPIEEQPKKKKPKKKTEGDKPASNYKKKKKRKRKK